MLYKPLLTMQEGWVGRREGGWAVAAENDNTTNAALSELSTWEAESAASTNAATIWHCTPNSRFRAGSALYSAVAADAHGRILEHGGILEG